MKTAIALGTFDGIHSGHRTVLSQTEGFFSIAYTFKIPPKAVISGAVRLLMTPDDRAKALYELGIDKIVMNDFCDIRELSPEEFLDQIYKQYNPKRIVCGFNYRFGKNAAGDCEMLGRFCRKKDIEFICCDGVECDGKTVSSTTIRELIENGKIKAANAQMYREFSFSGEVINGDHRGRTIGFPTINQIFPELLVTPKHGVYRVRVSLDGKEYDGISNIGIRPTFKTESVISETFIKDFSGNAYGKIATVTLKSFLREERKFPSIDELKAAIQMDINSLQKQ